MADGALETTGTLRIGLHDNGDGTYAVETYDLASGGGGGGGGTQYTEDVPAAADPVGNALIARRRDTPTAAEVSNDGDNITLNATPKGELRVNDADLIAKLPALGQALVTSSWPVALPATQITTLTPPAAITGFALESGGNLATLAGAISAARLAANLIAGQAGVDGGSGVVSAKTLRAVLATDVALPAGEAHLGEVGSKIVRVSAEFTRPPDTIQYAVGDVVSNSTSSTTLLVIPNFARVVGGSGYITGIRITTDKKSITPRFRVHIFNDPAPTRSVDNVQHQEKYADESKRIAAVDLGSMITAADATNSDNSRASDWTLRIPFVAASGTRDIYVLLETLDIFTPNNGQKFTVTLKGDLN